MVAHPTMTRHERTWRSALRKKRKRPWIVSHSTSPWSAAAAPVPPPPSPRRAAGRGRCCSRRAACLGGAATLRNVLTYCGLYTLGDEPRQAVKGVAEEVMQGLRRLGAVTGPQRHRGVFVVFDPEAVKLRARFAVRRSRRAGDVQRLRLRRHPRRRPHRRSPLAGPWRRAHDPRPRLRRCQRRGRSRPVRRRRDALRQRWRRQSRHARHALRRHSHATSP